MRACYDRDGHVVAILILLVQISCAHDCGPSPCDGCWVTADARVHRVQPPNPRPSCEYAVGPLISRHADRMRTTASVLSGGIFRIRTSQNRVGDMSRSCHFLRDRLRRCPAPGERKKNEYGPDWEGEGQMRRRPIRISREIVAGKKG